MIFPQISRRYYGRGTARKADRGNLSGETSRSELTRARRAELSLASASPSMTLLIKRDLERSSQVVRCYSGIVPCWRSRVAARHVLIFECGCTSSSVLFSFSLGENWEVALYRTNRGREKDDSRSLWTLSFTWTKMCRSRFLRYIYIYNKKSWSWKIIARREKGRFGLSHIL